MRKYLAEFFLAVLAGIMISIGGIIFLSLTALGTAYKIVGAIMFTVGLYAIVVNGLYLYTGKVGYLVYEKSKYLITLASTWLGNFVGTYLGARLMLLTDCAQLKELCDKICVSKLNETFVGAFALAVFCGILMFIAVDGYKKTKNPLILFLCVSVFILCGFEHCIANMFYFSLSGIWGVHSLLYIIVVTIGNSIGGLMLPFFIKNVCP